ncbi:type II secretion system protein, partial [Clostridium perfringens]|nr:type II secretion system protein [Clostridium perfringens]
HNKNHNDLGWTINISHFDQYESIINIIYKNEKPYISENKEVKIYKFLEKSSQNLENQPQKEEEKHIY